MGFYNAAMHDRASVSAALTRLIRTAIERNGGWLPFDRFMAMALYAPGLGYYANHSRKFGSLPQSGSDFVTAPELSALFGVALARQVAQALQLSGTDELWEFGAGSGALAEQLLAALDGTGCPMPSTASGKRCGATQSSTCPARCASASASGSPRMATGCDGWTHCPNG
jgi:hypothetical protein